MTGGAVNGSFVGDCAVEGTVFDLHGCECGSEDAESAKVTFGILIHILGSVGINTGQNLQALGLVRMAEEERNQCGSLCKSRLWVIGCTMFISCSMLNFAALTLASASILVPLEAVQFVCNVAFGKVVRKMPIPPRMYGGVLMMCFGVGLAVYFGERGTHCFTIDDLKAFWLLPEAWGWWLWLAISFAVSIVCLFLHRRAWNLRAEGRPIRNAAIVMPILYAIPSALLGGGQMIVQSKCLSELMEIMFTQGDREDYVLPLADPHGFFWIEFFLVSCFGLFWFFRLTQCLGMYEPLFIIPLMQAQFIVWGGIAGGIFFGEFKNLHNGPAGWGGWPLYLGGLVLIVMGLYLVRPVDDGSSETMPAADTGSPKQLPPPADSAIADGPSPLAKTMCELTSANGWVDANGSEAHADENGGAQPSGAIPVAVVSSDPVTPLPSQQ